MKRTLYLLALFICRQTKALDNEKQLAQQLIDIIRASDLTSWKSLVNVLSTTFEIDNTSGSGSTADDDNYNFARKKALHWLSSDEYAQTLANESTAHTDEGEGKKKKQNQLLQRYALATIYYSTSQNEWTSCGAIDTTSPCDNNDHRYLSSSNHLSWEGINGKNGLVTWLDLNTKNLSNHCPSDNTLVEYDVLPLELTLLSPSLELLWLHSNPLCGTIPSYIGEFTSLQSLSVYSTNMSGILPESIYDIEKLSSIRLYKSHFSGGISANIKELKNLKWLWIHENEFTGPLPELESLTLLEGITLHGNQFTNVESLGLCGLLKGNLKYLWTDCHNGSIVREGGEWAVVEGEKACECCTRCFPRVGDDAVAID